MSRISACFEDLRRRGRKALIPYVTAGDPERGATVPLMHAMVESGADIVELGVPFSDPMADGPVIQAACERALRGGMTLEAVLGCVAEFRRTDHGTPVVLMGYLNPYEVMGYERFAEKAAAAGVDGVLTVDMPPEEGHGFLEALKGANIDPIFLLAPTSTDPRIASIAAAGSGFVYYVSLKGVTGASTLNVDAVRTKVAQIRAHCTLPVGVGFGISDATSAAEVAEVADAVVVGSAIVRQIATHTGDRDRFVNEISNLLVSMRAAMDAGGTNALETPVKTRHG